MFSRTFNTNRLGEIFNQIIVQQAWNKAVVVSGYNPTYVRADICGALIERKQYGNTTSKYGWEIDHIVPVASGGQDVISNLQPLQWENNRAKSDGPLVCVNRKK